MQLFGLKVPVCVAGGQAWTSCSLKPIFGGHAQGPVDAQTFVSSLRPALCARGLDENGTGAPSPTDASPSGASGAEPIHGDTAEDAGDEVRFSVKLTRIDRLKDTYNLDIRRLKGILRSYKFLYNTIRECICFTCVL